MGCSSSLAVDVAAERNLRICVDIVQHAYGITENQVGFTDGHVCVTKEDKVEATRSGSSLLYGEILPTGITKLLDMDHLQAAKASVLYDLGMGVGKLCMQAFLQYPNLRSVVGIEITFSRFKLAETAMLRLVKRHHDLYEVTHRIAGERIRIQTIGKRKPRSLEFRRGNMWGIGYVKNIDIFIIHTELTVSSFPHFQRTLVAMKRKARFITYQDLSKYWTGEPPPFQRIEANLDENDTFATSWSQIKGHHLYCWEKTARTAVLAPTVHFEETKESLDVP